jgi:glutamate transport system substrate-binding protein
MRRFRTLLPVLGLLMLGALGCSSGTGAAPGKAANLPSFPADSYMARIQQRGQLIVGVKYDTPPFGSLNPINNQVEGFDADLARELARAIFGDET